MTDTLAMPVARATEPRESALQESVERYAADPSPAHGRAVAVAALPFVRSLTRRITLPDHPLATYRDLENAGMLGMLQALQSYDPSRGTPFASFSYGRIRGALVDFLRTIDCLSRDRRRRVAEAARTAETLQQELGAEPHTGQIAARLGVSVREVDRLRADAQQRFAMSLHTPESDARPAPLDVLAAPDAVPADAAAEHASLVGRLDVLLARLPEREQGIVTGYFYDGRTLREIAEGLGLTEARISQILSKTLRSLRVHFADEPVGMALAA